MAGMHVARYNYRVLAPSHRYGHDKVTDLLPELLHDADLESDVQQEEKYVKEERRK